MRPKVSIEEAQLGTDRWAVIITRSGEIFNRSLWGRYGSQAEATKAAKDAAAYLASRPKPTADAQKDQAGEG